VPVAAGFTSWSGLGCISWCSWHDWPLVVIGGASGHGSGSGRRPGLKAGSGQAETGSVEGIRDS
jgi:hypothetical protein